MTSMNGPSARDSASGKTARDAGQTEGQPPRAQFLTVAEVADLNHNGIYDDAPNVVTDVNYDGKVDANDLKAIGVASNIVTVPFHINGASA